MSDLSEIDNDAYCVCTHDFSPCTHRNIRPVRTMYAVKISGMQTVYGLMRTQIKILLKLSQNDNLSNSIVRLLCQQSKSSYNMNAASDRFILHTMQYIMYLQQLYHKRVFRSVSVNQRFIHKFISSVSLWFIE